MKRIIALLFVTLMIAVLFSACGEKSADSTPDEASVVETTVVLETTADGGTVEEDSDGNKITKNADGKVVAAEDKNGNPIDVDKYLETHNWVEKSGNSSDSSDKSGSSDSGKGQSGSDDTSSDDSDEITEDEIPVVIATIPDDEDDIIELPDM